MFNDSGVTTEQNQTVEPVNPQTSRMKDVRFESSSEARTERFGQMLAQAVEPGTTIALDGNLGAGKTHLVAAIAVGLGVHRRQISSPTFVLIHEYEGRLPVYHFDACRLGDVDEFLALGVTELFESDGVCLVEWACRVEAALPADRVAIRIEHTGPTSRTIEIRSTGERSERVVEQLRALPG